MGFGCGIITVLKNYIMEVTDDKNLAEVYSYLGMGSSVGDLAGPLIAGTLSHLDRRFEVFNFRLI